MSESVNETIRLFKLGWQVSQLSEQRLLKEATIYGHLQQGLQYGVLKFSEVFTLSNEQFREIKMAIQALPTEQQHLLKPLYEKLAGRYEYQLLSCFKAAFYDRNQVWIFTE